MADVTINGLDPITRVLRDGICAIEDDLVTPKKQSNKNVFDEFLQQIIEKQFLIVQNGNNPPTVQQNTKFVMENSSGGKNIIIESSNQTFTWGAGNFPAQSDGTWYLYCLGNQTDSNYFTDVGNYGASKNTPTYNYQKNGWHNTEGRVLASFDSSGGVVSNITIFEQKNSKSVSAAYTASIFDYIIEVTGTNTVNLPPRANWLTDTEMTIVNKGTGTITIQANGAETINGSNTQTITIQYGTLTIYNGASELGIK